MSVGRDARRGRFPFILALLLLSPIACAPSTAPTPGSAIVRQESRPAASGGGSEAAPQAAAQAGSGEQNTERTLVIGIATEVKGFSPLNNKQNKYVEDLVLGNLF